MATSRNTTRRRPLTEAARARNAREDAILTRYPVLNTVYHNHAQAGPPAATGRQFTVRRSDVHLPHENRYLAVFQTAGKSG
jgi:hypothetical protein